MEAFRVCFLGLAIIYFLHGNSKAGFARKDELATVLFVDPLYGRQ